jgi:hypothetical protein
MKKILKMAMAVAIFCFALLLCFAEASYKGVAPKGVQGAFYTKDFKCIYLKGSDELSGAIVTNKWQTYSVDITSNIGYDGMNKNYKGYTLFRIKAFTPSPNQEVVLYIDNVVLKDGAGNVILSFDFNDNENHGPYFSQGKEKADNGKVMTLNEEKCFLIHANSVNLYGYNGVEIQWNLPQNPQDPKGSWDFSAGGYVLSFDYYVATGN